jgi:hypothetical protein
MFAAATSNTVELVRYTSGVDADQSWFTIKRSGGVDRTFAILKGVTVQSWLDLSKGFFNGFVTASPGVDNAFAQVNFRRGPSLRREIAVGTYLIGSTDATRYAVGGTSASAWVSYGAVGRTGTTNNNYVLTSSGATIPLPTASATANPAYTADSNPVFHSLPFHPYVAESLPSDFGLSFHFASNAFDPGDTLVVTAGTEEWEVLAETAGTAGTIATPMFLARMV